MATHLGKGAERRVGRIWSDLVGCGGHPHSRSLTEERERSGLGSGGVPPQGGYLAVTS
jgi:hypothetical protein